MLGAPAAAANGPCRKVFPSMVPLSSTCAGVRLFGGAGETEGALAPASEEAARRTAARQRSREEDGRRDRATTLRMSRATCAAQHQRPELRSKQGRGANRREKNEFHGKCSPARLRRAAPEGVVRAEPRGKDRHTPSRMASGVVAIHALRWQMRTRPAHARVRGDRSQRAAAQRCASSSRASSVSGCRGVRPVCKASAAPWIASRAPTGSC